MPSPRAAKARSTRARQRWIRHECAARRATRRGHASVTANKSAGVIFVLALLTVGVTSAQASASVKSLPDPCVLITKTEIARTFVGPLEKFKGAITRESCAWVRPLTRFQVDVVVMPISKKEAAKAKTYFLAQPSVQLVRGLGDFAVFQRHDDGSGVALDGTNLTSEVSVISGRLSLLVRVFGETSAPAEKQVVHLARIAVSRMPAG